MKNPRLNPQERESITRNLSELERIVKEGQTHLDNKGNASVGDTERGSKFWLVDHLSTEYKIARPEPTIRDTVNAAYLIAEKMKNRLAGDHTDRQIEEAQNRALQNAEQLTTDNYGNLEINRMPDNYHEEFNPTATVLWDDKRLHKITRARWIGDIGIGVDLSYCHGVLEDGQNCRVILPDELRHIRGATSERALRKVILDVAKKHKVYAKGLGIFEAISLFVN